MWRLPVIAAVALVGALGTAGAAGASARQESLVVDDDLLLHATPESVDETMAFLSELGVDRVRLSVIWRNLAPGSAPADGADPAAYAPELLDPLDVAVTAAAEHRLAVLLNVRGGAPAWALGASPPAKIADRDAYKPDAAAFGAFVRMLGRRYDGTYRDSNRDLAVLPRVTAWSIWNEPNWSGHLQPQSQRHRRTGRMRTFAPALYRRLHRAATAGLAAAGHGSDVVLLGETAPIGSRRLSVAAHIKPGRFLRDLFCLNARLRPLKGRASKLGACDFAKAGPLVATGYAHHPYPVTLPPERRSREKDVIGLADSKRLAAILDAARRHKRLQGRLPIWYTEFGYQTNPPDARRGVSVVQQARWLVRAERLTANDRRVLAMNQFLLRDAGPNPGYHPGHRFYWSTYQTGLQYNDGSPKPALEAWRLPFMTLGPVRNGRPLRLWGMVRPGEDGRPQAVRIEHRASATAAWRPVRELTVNSLKGYFTVRLRRARKGSYRFQWLREGGPLASASAVPSR